MKAPHLSLFHMLRKDQWVMEASFLYNWGEVICCTARFYIMQCEFAPYGRSPLTHDLTTGILDREKLHTSSWDSAREHVTGRYIVYFKCSVFLVFEAYVLYTWVALTLKSWCLQCSIKIEWTWCLALGGTLKPSAVLWGKVPGHVEYRGRENKCSNWETKSS